MKNKDAEISERVEAEVIVLDGLGHYPRTLKIIEKDRELEYRLIRTKSGKFQLTK